jgi:hypothetical protein
MLGELLRAMRGGRNRVNPPVPTAVPRLVSLLAGSMIEFVIGGL